MAGGNNSKAILDSAVTALADRLDYTLLNYNPEPPTKQKNGPQRYLFPTGAYALEIWSPGDEIHLVALTDNTSKIFWSFVAEKLGLEVLPESIHSQAKLELEHGIWLHYCAMPGGFDMTTIGGYGFPEYARGAFQPSAVRQNLDLLRDTKQLLDQCSGQLQTFKDTYQHLRQWAEDAGLWSSEFGMLVPDALIWLIYTSAAWTEDPPRDSKELIRECLTRLQDSSEIANLSTPSNRPAFSAPAGLSADNRTAIGSAAYWALRTASPYSSREHFHVALAFGQVVRIQAWCFLRKDAARFQATLVQFISSLRAHLDHGIRIWPYVHRPSETEWTYLLRVDKLRDAKIIAQVSTKQFAGMGGVRIEIPYHREIPAHISYQDSRRQFEEPQPASSLITSANGKQPSASQVLSRLRWDPAFANESYEVGYLDRFEGVKWLPLELWGKATEEEDFIPEHRIRVFRKAGAGKAGVVWQRLGPEGKMWSG